MATDTTRPGPVRRALRWMYGTVPRGIAFTLVFVLLLAVGYLRAANWLGGGPLSEGCPKPSANVSPTSLDGEFTGPDGMRITLTYPDHTFRVTNWPLADSAPDYGSSKRFDGTGTWDDDELPGADGTTIALRFRDDPAEEPVSKLAVGGDNGAPVLFEDRDPDVCPSLVFHRA
ncbi:hypothetical protein I5Q34_13080 [Streptomyces sp. AV19]|uniref:hypothetical protein n=1 Tax=Streptomyces sp. AV19 TaxID=2793068 RepID=UPI0018FE4811|nr:hypothetical protein [Streptomyces sp. AV19]MBH1935196.1 hypothetical protein [Streptomyces sp. AV19]MDG4532025.1 hypothetical protein [Streptomyces sp. AV19]